LSWAQPLIETPQFTANDLQELAAKAVLVNPVLNRDRFARAIRNPKRALNVLVGRTRMGYGRKPEKK
jgi:hypothetical protein